MFKPKKIYIDVEVENASFTETILNNLAGVPIEFIDDPRLATDEILSKPDPIGQGKKHLLITSYKGRMLKPCPGTPKVICCHYQILSPVIGCPLDCTYCALQMYFNNPLITMYANINDLMREMDERLQRKSGWPLRIGTGELTDSLELDHITEMSRLFIPYFSKKSNVLFELKTKSNQINNLLDLNHGGKTVVAWSVNPQTIIDKEEMGCASLEERLQAARQCQEAGYKLAFHFDPIIYSPDWEEGYESVVESLFEYIDPQNIVWISLGTFRYPPSLKPIIRERCPRSKIIDEEFIPGQDGKMRYLKPIRVGMYSKVLSQIRSHNRNVFIYLCMESTDVWRKVFGWTPKNTADLARMFRT
ncbi:MAG: hypothetical protein JSV84_12500 [Gemmatimonadota bacterium]|nr:MAG: hypothetical protein JSV84_12500 [Gemmatimonadota bacterium]